MEQCSESGGGESEKDHRRAMMVGRMKRDRF